MIFARIQDGFSHRIAFGTKAEARRKKRSVRFPGAMQPAGVWIVGAKVYTQLKDGTFWRLFLRGGKTGRRRLKRPCLTISMLRPIDPSASYEAE